MAAHIAKMSGFQGRKMLGDVSGLLQLVIKGVFLGLSRSGTLLSVSMQCNSAGNKLEW